MLKCVERSRCPCCCDSEVEGLALGHLIPGLTRLEVALQFQGTHHLCAGVVLASQSRHCIVRVLVPSASTSGIAIRHGRGICTEHVTRASTCTVHAPDARPSARIPGTPRTSVTKQRRHQRPSDAWRGGGGAQVIPMPESHPASHSCIPAFQLSRAHDRPSLPRGGSAVRCAPRARSSKGARGRRSRRERVGVSRTLPSAHGAPRSAQACVWLRAAASVDPSSALASSGLVDACVLFLLLLYSFLLTVRYAAPHPARAPGQHAGPWPTYPSRMSRLPPL